MTPEEQLLLQQQQKLEGIEQQQRYNLFRSPGQVQGEITQQFAAGKQAANSQAQGYGANPAPISQPVVQQAQKVEPVKQVQPIEKVKPVERITQQPSITSMDDLARAMGYTSPQEEERMRKSSIANQRILAIGDALRHIGNIANTVRYAPAQQFNNPVQEELTRYQQGKALRDRANQTYLTYQQQKAEQERMMRQLENEENYRNAQLGLRKQELDRLDKQYELNERKADWQRQYQQGTLDIKKEQQKLNEEYKRGMLSVAQYRAATYALNSNKSGGGRGGSKGMDEYTTTTETTYNYDKLGKRTGTTTKKKRTVNGKAQPTQTTNSKKNPYGDNTKKGNTQKNHKSNPYG